MKAKKQKLKAITEKFSVLHLNTLKSINGGAIPACEPELCVCSYLRCSDGDKWGCYCPPCP